MKRIISLLLALFVLLTSFCAYASEYGIDVSHNNESVDYAAVKDSGYKFVMIRLGYYNKLDTKFFENVKAASEAGLEYGVYLYSYAFNDEEAKTEADFVIKTLSELGEYKSSFTLPVAYDIEDKQLFDKGRAQITRNVNIFCSSIEKSGYIPMIYSNADTFKNYIDVSNAKQNGWKIWLAKWESNPDFTKRKQIDGGMYADIWQYKKGDSASDTVNKYDSNIAYDFASLKRLTKPAPVIKRVSLKKLASTKKGFKASWEKVSNASGYQLQYSKKKSFKGKKTVKTKSLTKKIKKLKKKKKYYVRVRAYVIQNGKVYYGKWSKVKAVKTK